MNNATKDFFKNSELTTSSVRGFLKGLKVNPLEENKIIEDCKINNDKISRKKLIIWIVGFMENQKQGLGRDFLEKSGFNSLDEIE